MSSGGEEMSFWDHLDVLRGGLIRIVAVLFVAMAGSFVAIPRIFDSFILAPARSDFFLYRFIASLLGGKAGGWLTDPSFNVEIININVSTQFMMHLEISFWAGALITFPYIVYEVWKFIKPALFPHEEKNLSFAFLFGTVMFFLGCALGYCVVFPLTFRFLTEYNLSMTIENRISLNSYMHNFLLMIFVMGVVFELPLLTWLLSRLGLIDRAWLRKYRKHAVVVLMILAAVITPSGDPFTLMVVFLPLYLLFELGIILARKEVAAVENKEG